MKKSWILAGGMLVAIGLVAGCSSQPRQVAYVPPTTVTTAQNVPGDVNTAVVVQRPIPGQVCWKKKSTWYCRPATHPAVTHSVRTVR